MNDAEWTWKIAAKELKLAPGFPLLRVLFDPAWYLSNFQDALKALDEDDGLTALEHYLSAGSDGRAGTPFFDADWYLHNYADVLAPQVTNGFSDIFALRLGRYLQALTHYLTVGCFEGRNPNALFDEAWYQAEYGDAWRHGAYLNNYHHFLAEGANRGYNPSPLFEEHWYRGRYEDVEAALASGLLASGFHDYMHRSLRSERDPCPYFNARWYRKRHLGSRAAKRFAYVEFLMSGSRCGYNPSPHFDERWYCTEHASARAAVSSGAYRSGYFHYLYEGAKLNCAPNPYFQPDWYGAWYPPVAQKLAAGEYAHAFEHYLREGRAKGFSPNLYFEETWYLHTYPDLKRELRDRHIESGHDHFLFEGIREKRSGSTIFDGDWYETAYPDVREFVKNGLAANSYDHFCRYGRKANYSPCADFDEAWYRKENPDVEEQIEEGKWVDALHHFVVDGLLEGRLPKPSIVEDKREQNRAVSTLARLELTQFLAHQKRLACATDDRPLVSVLLVLYNRAELTLRCLHSIVAWAEVPYEIVIVDNASSDETQQLLNRVEGVRLIRNERNLHFLRAANQAAAAARGKYILFLNNDSELQVGAVSSAVALLESDRNIGAVGGKIILNHGVLQEAGSYLMESGFSMQFGRGEPPFRSDYMHRRDVPYCSGAFLMTPAATFAQLGGFDPAFLPAYCEDADYCLRLWDKGLHVVFNPDSMILHHETGSSRYRRFLYPSVVRNIALLRDRYSEYLASVPNYALAPVSSLDGRAFRPAYLIVVDSLPQAKGSARFSALISRMIKEGLFLSIYPLEPWTGERSDLPPYISPEVEVVGERGIDELEEFCRARPRIYQGVLLVDATEAGHDLRGIRQWLPGTPVFADRESYVEPEELLTLAFT